MLPLPPGIPSPSSPPPPEPPWRPAPPPARPPGILTFTYVLPWLPRTPYSKMTRITKEYCKIYLEIRVIFFLLFLKIKLMTIVDLAN